MSEQVNPYNETQGKTEQVRQMFNNIAGNYDFLNHFLSFGIDVYWRKRAIRKAQPFEDMEALDIATGTGDLAIMLAKRGANVRGIDLSPGMMEKGKEKVAKRGLSDKISFDTGDASNLSFADKEFDAITVAFGVRNFEKLEQSLKEMYRVLKPQGRVVILEFSRPQNALVRSLYNFYNFRVLPFFGRLISKDNRAYEYLPESISQFKSGKDFVMELEKAGFCEASFTPLSCGIVTIYCGERQ
ncbi:MAG: bifunctional demethylmenaquinone methyltransferase/2-methoxy-6-polyprenyl-1,4-benzoquinol methylase UbiE [Bacteroidales bacterium]